MRQETKSTSSGNLYVQMNVVGEFLRTSKVSSRYLTLANLAQAVTRYGTGPQ